MANPFAIEQKHYEQFPDDQFIDVCLLAYSQADLPPGPLATTNDPVPSVKFLFGGYVKDEDGNFKLDDNGKKVVVRKWTNWLRISDSKNAKLMKLFDTSKNGFNNLFDMLQDCETIEGKLWSTPMKILLETDDEYQNIVKIKPGTNSKVVEEIFYSESYVPYKVAKAYGKQVMLTIAACKFFSGVKTFLPDEMAEPSSGDNNN